MPGLVPHGLPKALLHSQLFLSYVQDVAIKGNYYLRLLLETPLPFLKLASTSLWELSFGPDSFFRVNAITEVIVEFFDRPSFLHNLSVIYSAKCILSVIAVSLIILQTCFDAMVFLSLQRPVLTFHQFFQCFLGK